MRIFVALALLTAIHFQAGTLLAQGKKTDPDKTDKTEQPDKTEKPPVKEIKDIGGKTVEQWLEELHNKDRGKAEIALRILLQFPHEKNAEKVLPELIKELGKHTFTLNSPLDANMRFNLVNAIGSILAFPKRDAKLTQQGLDILAKELKDSQFPIRIGAMKSIQAVGSDAQGHLEDILKAMEASADVDIRLNGMSAMGFILGSIQKRDPAQVKRSLEVLSKQLTHTQFPVRVAAMQVMKVIGLDAQSHLGDVITAVESTTDIDVRLNGIETIGMILGGNQKQREPALVKRSVALFTTALTDPQLTVRIRALTALARLGPDAKSAKAAVENLIADKGTWELRQAAVTCLPYIALDPAGPDILLINQIRTALKDDCYHVRVVAAQALGFLGLPKNKFAADALLKDLHAALNDPEVDVQVQASLTLIHLKEPQQALVHLCGLLSDPKPSIRAKATQAVGSQGEKAKACMPQLRNNLKDKSDALVVLTIVAIAQMGDSAQPAVSTLTEMSEDTTRVLPIRQAAKDALAVILGKGKKDKTDKSEKTEKTEK